MADVFKDGDTRRDDVFGEYAARPAAPPPHPVIDAPAPQLPPREEPRHPLASTSTASAPPPPPRHSEIAAAHSGSSLADEPPAQAAAAAAQPDQRKVVSSVGIAELGSGVLRQVTYFPVTTILTDAGRTNPPSNAWLHKSVAYRRYSEMLMLRRYLVLMHPRSIIPPLPPKSTAQHMNTWACSNETLEEQRMYLGFFVDGLCHHPALLADGLVQQFLQLPRDGGDGPQDTADGLPATGSLHSLGSFSAARDAVSRSISNLEEHLDRSDPSVFGNTTTAVVGGVMRSTARAISSWFSGSQNPPSPNVTETDVRAYLAQVDEFKGWAHRHKTFCDARFTFAAVTETARQLKVAAEDEQAAQRHSVDALMLVSSSLSAEPDAELREAAKHAHDVFSKLGSATDNQARVGRHTYARMLKETLMIGAAVEAVELQMNRWRKFAHVALNKIDRTPQSTLNTMRAQLGEGDKALSAQLKKTMHEMGARVAFLNATRRSESVKVLTIAIREAEESISWSVFQSSQYLQ